MTKFFTTFLCALAALVYAQPQIVFKAQPEAVEIGDTVVVSWRVRAADVVYLTSHGRVEPDGQLAMAPQKASTTLTLLAQSAEGLAAASLTITVRGGRGDVFPNEEEFRNAYEHTFSASLLALLDAVHAVLQNELGFVVEERHDRRTGKTVFVTTLAERREWVKSEESGIRGRKLAYWVEVEENKVRPGSFSCRIKALIQYQRRKESKWRAELQERFYRDSADALRQSLELTLAKGQ
jgi:hypothetical protein